MKPKIIPNTNPALRLLALAWDPATETLTRHDLSIIGWYLTPGRYSEPIAVPPLRSLAVAVADAATGRCEIPGGASFANADEALEVLGELAKAKQRREEGGRHA